MCLRTAHILKHVHACLVCTPAVPMLQQLYFALPRCTAGVGVASSSFSTPLDRRCVKRRRHSRGVSARVDFDYPAARRDCTAQLDSTRWRWRRASCAGCCTFFVHAVRWLSVLLVAVALLSSRRAYEFCLFDLRCSAYPACLRAGRLCCGMRLAGVCGAERVR